MNSSQINPIPQQSELIPPQIDPITRKSNFSTKLFNIISPIAKYFNISSSITLVIMMTLTFVDVIGRYFFHRPIKGAMELVELMLALIVALAYANSEAIKGHMIIEFFPNKLPPKIRAALETVTDLICLGTLIVITVNAFAYANSIKLSNDVTSVLLVPVYPFAYLVAIGWALFTVVKLINLMKSGQEKGKQFLYGFLIGTVIILLFSLIPVLRESAMSLEPSTVGILGIALMLILIFGGMYIGMALITVSVSGMMYVAGTHSAFTIAGLTPFSSTTIYSYTVFPLFIFMGAIVYHSGIGEDIFKCVNKWFGHMAGGLAYATVVGSAFFAAISGSGTANSATMGKVALPEMNKLKYNPRLSTAVIAAGGTLGVLIPPSSILVLYGMLTQQPIGKMFLAGIIPGITQALLYMTVVFLVLKRHPDWGPPAPEKRVNFKEKIISVKYIWPVAALFGLVMGGIYFGIFTPTEAAGVGAMGGVICAIIKGGFSFKKFKTSSIEAASLTGNIQLILVGAVMLGTFLAVTRIPFLLAQFVADLDLNRYVILGIIIVLFLLLGSIMEIFSVVIVLIPVVTPLIIAVGFDPIWFGVLVTRLFEVGALTPPIGLNVFVMNSVAPDVPVEEIFKGVTPFYISDMIGVLILVLFPQLATFLPSLLG